MTTPPEHVRLEALLAHRTWVRGLARSLVRDENAVDDLEQETWMAAMRRPPTGAPKPWLGAVVRNLAGKSRRSAGRRLAREGRVARPEAALATGDVVADAEVHERVVRAVLDLAEPYKTTVLLRFFDGLPPRDIAARMDVPVETVRTRVRRGLARMREGFDAETGDRHAWVAALAPLVAAPPRVLPVAAVAGGALLVSTKVKLLIVLGVVLLVGALFITNPFAAGTTEDGPEVVAAAPTTDAHDPELTTAGAPPSDDAASAPAELPPSPADGARARIRFRAGRGRVFSAEEIERRFQETGTPRFVRWISTAMFVETNVIEALLLQDDTAWVSEARLVNEDGELRIRPRPTDGTWHLFLSRPGSTPSLSHPVAFDGDAEPLIEVGLEETPRSRVVRVVDAETDQPVVGARVFATYTHGDDGGVGAVFEAGDRHTDAYGTVRLPLAGWARETSWWIETPTHMRRLPSAALIGDPDEPLEVALVRRVGVAGTAYLKDGKPAAGLPVIARTEGRRPFRTVTAADGTFRFDALPCALQVANFAKVPGAAARSDLLIALVEDPETMQVQMTRARARPGETAQVTFGAPSAAAQVVLKGRVTAGGVPLGGVLVMASATEGGGKPHIGKTDADGRYEIRGLRAGHFTMALLCGDPRAGADDFILQAERTEHVLRAGSPVELDFDLPGGFLEVTVVDNKTGKPIPGAVVMAAPQPRVTDTERFPGFTYGVGWAEQTGTDGVALLKALPEGDLELLVFRGGTVPMHRSTRHAGTHDAPATVEIRVP